jgi:hypothetical protein
VEALYSVLVRKQAEIIRVQQEIQMLKELARQQEQAEVRHKGWNRGQWCCFLSCILLLDAMIVLSVISRL